MAELQKEYLKILGDEIKTKRKERGMTQAELAAACGYDFTMISKIEAGQIDLPISKIRVLAKALRSDPVELVHDYLVAVDEAKELEKQLEVLVSSMKDMQKQYDEIIKKIGGTTWHHQSGMENAGDTGSRKTE